MQAMRDEPIRVSAHNSSSYMISLNRRHYWNHTDHYTSPEYDTVMTANTIEERRAVDATN